MKYTAALATVFLEVLSYCSTAAALPAAQEKPTQHPWSVFWGYTSYQLQNPGFHAGLEYPLASTQNFVSVVAVAAQATFQPHVESGYALHARWGQRFQTNFGLTFEGYFGIGAQLTVYDTTHFEFENAQGTAKRGTATRLAFSPNLVFGPGFDFERALGFPLHVYAHPGLTLRYPDLNLAFHASVIAELGVRWTLK